MNLKLAGTMTAAAVVLKLLLFLLNLPQQRMALFTIFIYLFIILIGTFFAVRHNRSVNMGSSVQDDVKAGMRAVGLFAIMASIFVWVYYSYIDTHYFPQLINDRVEMATTQAADNSEIDLENVRQTAEMFFSPKVHSTITLFGILISGAIYSLIISVMMRKIPGFK